MLLFSGSALPDHRLFKKPVPVLIAQRLHQRVIIGQRPQGFLIIAVLVYPQLIGCFSIQEEAYLTQDDDTEHRIKGDKNC